MDDLIVRYKMSVDPWRPPSWELPLDEIDTIEAYRIPSKSVIAEIEWPEHFWKHVADREVASPAESSALLSLFKRLQVSEPARCHIPPYGIAGYANNVLIFTSTLCFECSNAYVYTEKGKELRAFDVNSTSAKNLLQTLAEHFKIKPDFPL